MAMYIDGMGVDDYIKSVSKVRTEVEKITAEYSFADAVMEAAFYSRENVQSYFNLLWKYIPDGYLYKTYKEVLLDVSPHFYPRMFAEDLLEKVRRINKHDISDNPSLRGRLNADGYLTIYHGHVKKTLKNANSWTTEPETAHFFGCRNAHRQCVDDYYVVSGKIKLEDVIAYITERNEREIVILNRDVKGKKKEFFKLSETDGKYEMFDNVI